MTKRTMRSILFLIALSLIEATVVAQKTSKPEFFDPNPNVVVEHDQIRPFLAQIPEVLTKAEYYRLSKTVLQTILVVQSNAGNSICDGQFNYCRGLSTPRNRKYEAFAKSKNGFALCEKRSRGVELAALSMHQMRDDGKTLLSDEQWMQMVFGPAGDLAPLHESAKSVFQILSGKAFSFEERKSMPVVAVPSVEKPAEKPVEKAEKAMAETPVAAVPAVEKPVEKAEKTMAETPVVAVPSVEKTVEKPVEKAEKAMAETSTAAVPAVEKTVEKPVEKAEKPMAETPKNEPKQADMAQKTTEIVLPAKEAMVEPPTIEPVKIRKNIIKSNVLFPIAVGYERALGQHFSVSLNGSFLPKMGFGNAETRSFGRLSLVKPSVGFSADGRYYLSKKKAQLTGFYLGGFFTRRDADGSIRKISTSGNTRTDATITIPTGLIMYGAMLGKQRIRRKGLTTDFSLGVGPYRVYSIPDLGAGGEEPFKTLSKFTKYKAGIGPRATASVGYAF